MPFFCKLVEQVGEIGENGEIIIQRIYEGNCRWILLEKLLVMRNGHKNGYLELFVFMQDEIGNKPLSGWWILFLRNNLKRNLNHRAEI